MKNKASPFIPELLKRYAKGLDNGATESYSKLSRFFLAGRPWRFLSLVPFTSPSSGLLSKRSHQLFSDSLTKCRFPSFPWQRSVFLLTPRPSVPLPSSRRLPPSRCCVRAQCTCLSLFLFSSVSRYTVRAKKHPLSLPPFSQREYDSRRHPPPAPPSPPTSVFPLHLVDGCASNASMRVQPHDRSISATDAFIRPGNSTYRAHRGFNLYANLKPVRLIADSYHFSRQLFSFFVRPYFHGFTANLFLAPTRERKPETRV